MKLKTSYGILIVLFLFFFIPKTTHADGTISACGSIDTAGTYTLSSDIGTVGSTSDCLTITVPGVTIDGAGHTVNGNIRGANGITENHNGTIGVEITLQNIIVIGNLNTGDGGGSSPCNGSGNGGLLSITNSSIQGNVVSGNGGQSGYCGAAGNGGDISINNSTFGNISSGSGGGANWAGSGGSVTITNTDIDLSGKVVTLGQGQVGFDDCGGCNAPNDGANGVLSLIYSGNIYTNPSTYVYYASYIVVNSTYLNSPNGVFNLYPIVTGLSGIAFDTAIDLSWTAPDAGVVVVTDYLIEYKKTADDAWLAVTHTPSTATTISILNLTSGTSYDFRVSAITNLEMTGPTSDVYTLSTTTPIVHRPNQGRPPIDTIASTHQSIPIVAPTGQASSNLKPYTNSFIFSKNLQPGNKGNDVKQLQIFLNTQSYTVSKKGKETTTFGSLTKKALMKFQKDNKLIPTGILGPVTRGFINTMK